MSKEAYLKFQETCYGRSVGIVGPLIHNLRVCEVGIAINKNWPPSFYICDHEGDCFYCTSTVSVSRGVLDFLSGPVGWEELAAEPPELWQDNAFHHSIDFSPLTGILALEKVRHTGARKIYMLGMDLYKGDQSRANMHDLKKNAAYLKSIVDTDRRVVLCEELKEAMLELTL